MPGGIVEIDAAELGDCYYDVNVLTFFLVADFLMFGLNRRIGLPDSWYVRGFHV